MREQTVYGPLELPSGKKITFRMPKGRDKVEVFQLLPLSESNMVSGAMLADMYLAAKCLVTVNDQPVPLESFKRLFDDWDDADVTFYQAVFNEIRGSTKEQLDRAKEAASFLLNKQT